MLNLKMWGARIVHHLTTRAPDGGANLKLT